MPIFEYKCDDCDKISEFLEAFGSRTVKSCVHCGSRHLKKRFSMFSAGIKEGASNRCRQCADDSCPHAGR